ncbi:MAG: hypothetical protein AAGD25_23835 [Cyanobacteria bacterium P01_F01_bin.150]
MNLSSQQSTDALSGLTSGLIPKQTTGQSLLEHLKKIDGWHGDDLEECLQLVRNTCSKRSRGSG